MGIPHDYTERKRSDEQCLSTLKSEKPNFRDGHYRGAPVRLGRAGGENYRTVALFSTLAVGLQNLYSSVRFRPAPPSVLLGSLQNGCRWHINQSYRAMHASLHRFPLLPVQP